MELLGLILQLVMGEQTVVSRARNLGTNDVDAARQQAMSRHPTGRLGVPDDIAKASFYSPPTIGLHNGRRARDQWRVDGTVTAVTASRRWDANAENPDTQ